MPDSCDGRVGHEVVKLAIENGIAAAVLDAYAVRKNGEQAFSADQALVAASDPPVLVG